MKKERKSIKKYGKSLENRDRFMSLFWERRFLLIIGIMAFALLIGIVLISALTTDFGELNSNIYTEQKVNHHLQVMDKALALSFRSVSPNPKQTHDFSRGYKSEGFGDIGDSYLFNSPSSPNPLQTPSFRMEYKSEGFGEEQNALMDESGYKWLFNYLNGGTIYNG